MQAKGPVLDLSTLAWTLSGWRPHGWRLAVGAATGGFLPPEVGPVPARFPGSVQQNLRAAGLLPDWNEGLNSLHVEWVEHRHWMFSTEIPAGTCPAGEAWYLCAETLDYSGWILVDGRVVAKFHGAHLPARIDLTAPLTAPGPHQLALVFDQPPEEEGQLGFTSRARVLKPRFSYGWDWCVRFVPIGARGPLRLAPAAAFAVTLQSVRPTLSADLQTGRLRLAFARDASLGGQPIEITARLVRHECAVSSAEVTLTSEHGELVLVVPSPQLWWPNGQGEQPLYTLEATARFGGREVAAWRRAIGFRHVAWQPCAGAPPGALPWICVVNHRAIFLQGVNWTPPQLDTLATKPEDTAALVAQYRDLGCNLLRVWGGAGLETEEFYEACDRAGLLVWQEFPLSSSGVDSVPPADAYFTARLCDIAREWIRWRQHHASLLLWCGGNELHREVTEGEKTVRVPLDSAHPVLAALVATVQAEDPDRRFLPTSPFGPRVHATREEFGRGLHHVVHGPWGLAGFADRAAWDAYWRDDDSLFRAEVGMPGASPAALIRRCAGNEPVWPPTNAFWRHRSAWWTQWDRLAALFPDAGDPQNLDRYVAHTQQEQADHLAAAARAAKARFPACGGFIVWMGHDVFPCPANTSIIDFDRKPKPAAHALAAIFRAPTPSVVET